MSKQTINIGSAANDNTGDTLRVGGDKVNDNFNELYGALGTGSDLTISLSNPGTGQVLKYNGASFVAADYNQLTSALDVNSNSIISNGNGDITLDPNGTGDVRFIAGGVTSVFDGSTGEIDLPAIVKYKNEYTAICDSLLSEYKGTFDENAIIREIAMIYTLDQEYQVSLDLLNRVIDKPGYNYVSLFHPLFDTLRTYPQFQDFLKKEAGSNQK